LFCGSRERTRSGGYRRICELAKLGLHASPTSIRRLIARPRLGPAPRRSGPSWREFLQAQAASIVACDFLTVETLFLRRYYVLLFIEHATRRVWLAGCTTNPDGNWVTQQARNLSFTGLLERTRFLIRDRDSKYTSPFDEVFRTEGIRIVKTPVRSPKANAIAETPRENDPRRVSRLAADPQPPPPRTCPPRLYRPLQHPEAHRALKLQPPDPADPPPQPSAREVQRRDRLGGLLHEYYRAAA
jgi:hypothetical protein